MSKKDVCPFCLTDKHIRYSILYDSHYCSNCERWVKITLDKEDKSDYNTGLIKGN